MNLAPSFSAAQQERWQERVDWLEKVGEETKEHRERRARQLERRADERRREARAEGLSATAAERAARWHGARANGQRTRITSIVECGEQNVLVTSCQACGEVAESSVGCGCRSLCRSCRSRLNKRKR